jgi:hypothetical protein
VTSLDALDQAVAEFAVTDPGLLIEPPARAAARRSLDSAGLLLLGETHGVRENPLLIRALMQAFGLTSLALEWPEDLAPVIEAFLAGQTLADHWFVWGGDGRITAGHLAVLAERAAAGPLELILFGGAIGADWSWSQRDEAMARRILAASAPRARTLAVSGQRPHPGQPHRAGRPDGRPPGRAAARRPGDPDQLRQRRLLQRRATPIHPPRRPGGPDTALPARQRTRPGPAPGHRGCRAPPTATTTTHAPFTLTAANECVSRCLRRAVIEIIDSRHSGQAGVI